MSLCVDAKYAVMEILGCESVFVRGSLRRTSSVLIEAITSILLQSCALNGRLRTFAERFHVF